MLQIRRKAGVVLIVVACASAAGLVHRWRRGAPAREAKRAMSEIRAQPAWRAVAAWRLAAESLGRAGDGRGEAATPIASESKPAQVTLAPSAAAAAHVEDATTHVGADVRLLGARDVAAQKVDGYAVFAGPGAPALPGGDAAAV
ncbi:MAG TPA: hypothetical protein VHO06_06585 [Polyangia bacterium]|nr:hypothetical protein [Polyangia bacterium]